MKLQYLEFNSFGVLAISGRSGSGKTSTARFLLSQFAMMSASLVICDPHGNSQQDNLATGIAPLAKSFACPVAITKDERMQAIRAVGDTLHNRIAGSDRSLNKIVLVLDEAARHFMECSKEENEETAKIFLSLANEGRRMNIRVILISQNFKQDFIGSRSIRSSITHVLFHQSSRDEVKLFSNLSGQAIRTIESLKRGHALLYPDMVTLSLPYISQDDLLTAEKLYVQASVQLDVLGGVQRRAEPKDDALLSTLLEKPMHGSVKPMHDHAPSAQNQQKSHETSKVADACKQILKLRKEGWNKEQAIYAVFGVKKHGANPKWKAASKLHDLVLEKYG